MTKHHPDFISSRKQAGVAIGRLCEKCDGCCVICRECTIIEHAKTDLFYERKKFGFQKTLI
jgi:hypothetical protein